MTKDKKQTWPARYWRLHRTRKNPPQDYKSLLTPKETQQAIYEVKNYIEQNLCKELNLMMVTVPLIVDVDSGVNDLLDRDGSRTQSNSIFQRP